MGYAACRLFNFLATSSKLTRIPFTALLRVELIIRLSRGRLYRNLRSPFVSAKVGSRKSSIERSTHVTYYI